MTAEVESVQGEVSSKVDKNGSEDRQEIAGSGPTHAMSHGINRVGNGGCNAKEETDPSRVFSTGNNGVDDDTEVSDPHAYSVADNAKKDGKEVEKEGKNGNSGDQKMEDRKIDDCPVVEDEESQTVAESDEPERVDDVEKEGFHPADGNSENGEMKKLESIEKAEESKDSEVGSVIFTDIEGQVKSDRVTAGERNQGEKIEEQEESDLKIDDGHKFDVVASKDVQHSEDEVNYLVDPDDRGESELVSCEIPSDAPMDEGLSVRQSAQTDSGPIVNHPESNTNDGFRSESVVVPKGVSFENRESGVKVSVSDNNGDVQLLSEGEKVHAPDDKFAIGSENGAHKASDCDENGDLLSESEAIEVASRDVKVPDSTANGCVQLESEVFKALDVVENKEVQSETRAVDVSVSSGSGNIHLESQHISERASDQDGQPQVASEATEIPACDQETGALLESRAVDVPGSGGSGNIHLESENISKPASDHDRQPQVASEAIEIPACDQEAGTQLESGAVEISASHERVDVAGSVEKNVPRTAIAECLSHHKDLEQNGKSELVKGPPSPALSEDGPAENVTSLEPIGVVSAQGSSEDLGLDMDQKIMSDAQLGQEVADIKEKCASTGQDQETAVEESLVVGVTANVCQNTADEPKSSPTGCLSAKASDEKTETLNVNLNGLLSGSDSKTTSKLLENSSDGAADQSVAVGSESDALQSGNACSETPVNLPTTDDREIETEVGKSSVVNVIEAISKDDCEDVTTEEVCETEDLNMKESSVTNAAEEVQSGTESFQSSNFPTVDNSEVEAVVENDHKGNDSESSCKTTCMASETKTSDRELEAEVALSTDTAPTETEDAVSGAVTGSTGSQPAEIEVGTNAIEKESRTSTCPAMGEEAEVETKSELKCAAETADATDAKVASISEDSDETSAKLRVEGEILKDQTTTSSREGPAVDASEGHTGAAEMERKPFYFLPRVPRYDDEKLAEQIKHAEAEVDQKTQSRDSIRVEIQKIKATCKEYDSNVRAAIAEEKSAKEALQSKRKEIDSLQSVINRAKSAISVDDIDTKVQRMEHMMQHETLPLKEEKQFIRDIKQLKQLREQISSNMGTQDEVQQALDDKEKTEESLKVLRKELDTLRGTLSKAEAVTKAARERYTGESDKLKKLLDQFKAADVVRQEAFAHLQNLRKQLREKNKYFFKYRDDMKAANEMALRKEREALQSFCVDQVGTFMNLWNNDEEFRKYYIRCNKRSTLRRLGTLDGRSLGPDEEPPQITRVASERADKLRTSNERSEKHEIVPPVSAQREKVIHFDDPKVEDGKPVATTTERKTQNNKSKKPIKSTPPPSGLAPILMEEAATEEVQQPKLTKEQEELMRKAEEKRKQEEAAKLKEQHRLEEITKAKEAMERKKKKEEKAKARAAVRAQKEAEEKEKEREKKLRKKERRKAATSEETLVATSDTRPPIPETQTETLEEIEPAEKQPTQSQPKKLHKPSQFLKQNKTKSIPPPLRNRSSRKRWQQWMWVALVALSIIILFFLGNFNFSFWRSNP